MNNLTIKKMHQEFVPRYDRWQGKVLPRLQAWFEHLYEISSLWLRGSQPYRKHGLTKGTCREHSAVEFGDLLFLSAEIIFLLTKIELKIVPQKTLQRVWNKLEERRRF